ncbi:MAG: hypothetical protein V3V35_01985 [Dehalococcoidia bacterium]
MQEPSEARIIAALEETRVVRPPKQYLATFGVTNLRYFLVTQPSYSELVGHEPEAVIREGKVIAKRPEVVTPAYMLNLEGFGAEARRSLELLAMNFGSNSPGLLYAYRNQAEGLSIVSGEPDGVADRIKGDLDGKGDGLAVVIRGADDLWDVSLLKFIFEYTAWSVAGNVGELASRGLLESDPVAGVPRAGVQSIEALFSEVAAGNADPSTLKRELDRWGLFQQYEDRFLGLFRRRR